MISFTTPIILLLILPYTLSLNILLSTSDSWVSKNSRHLHTALTNQGHNVILIAPLYFNNKYLTVEDFTSPTTTDGGEFGHLLDVNQVYYKNLLKINNQKLPRNFQYSKDLIKQQKLIDNNYQFGHDPLNNQIWYINSNPIISLKLSYDVILPHYFPDFTPDLIIFGPNEGSTLNSNLHDDILHVLINQADQTPVIFIQTNDNHNVYYQDEKYFNLNSQINQNEVDKTIHPQKQVKKNIFTTNLRFINKQINTLINNVMEQKSQSQSQLVYNVQIPSINHQYSKCTTTSINSPNLISFKSDGDTLKVLTKRDVKLPHFKLVNQDGPVQLDISQSSTSKTRSGVNDDKSLTDSDTTSRKILNDCDISVEIIEL